jgi:phosphate transport system protein
MTRIRFQRSLDDLKEKLLVMAGLAEQAIQRSIEAYRVRDLSMCDLVSRSEIAINRLEREIDQAALDLLAMEQPMAIDLRFILAVIKINADLERVGDAAKSISDRVRTMESMAIADLPVDIPRMASLAANMVRKSLQSFIEADAEMAHSVLSQDDAVDGRAFGSAGLERADGLPQPGAGGRSCNQYRRGRDLLGEGRRCSPQGQCGCCGCCSCSEFCGLVS